MGYETLQYDILLKDGPYEIRKYEPFVKMVTKSSYDSGFSKLLIFSWYFFKFTGLPVPKSGKS